ncbi:hypothetical protein HYW94_02590 [Candidatus Uhrbacteria bacterium]|nr:hypothetical protein [Candidatus Uhrbacteria bacterium]
MDGRVYDGRSQANIPFLVEMFQNFSNTVSKASGLRKKLRHDAGFLGFQRPSVDQTSAAKDAIKAAKVVKNDWYQNLPQQTQQALGTNMSAQDSSKTILTMGANRVLGLDAVFGLLDVGNDAALKVTVINTLNRITGNKTRVDSIQDRDVKSMLENLDTSAALQIREYRHYNKLQPKLDELCKNVGTSIESCIDSKTHGIPSSSRAPSGHHTPSHFGSGAVAPGGAGRLAAMPVN